MKIKTYILVITTIIVLTGTISVYGQNKITNEYFNKLEGTWVYKKDDVFFKVILFQKTLHFSYKKVDHLYGYSNLTRNNELIFNNLSMFDELDKIEELNISTLSEYILKLNGPNISISHENNKISATYYTPGFSRLVKFDILFDKIKDEMIWNFTNFSGKGEAWTDQAHFPAVPSTWVLKRVE